MTGRRIVGIVLTAVGILSLAFGGVFWSNRETVLDAGPLQLTTEKREGFAVPQVLGVLSLVGGIVLLVLPGSRRR